MKVLGNQAGERWLHIAVVILFCSPCCHVLASANPATATALLKDLKAWQVRTGALLPEGANPDYDPAARNRGGSRNDRGKGKRAG